VGCSARLTAGITGFCFSAVASSMDLKQVFTALLKFAYAVPDLINSLTDEAFQKEKLSLIKTKLRADVSLNQAAKSFWTIIEDGIQDFCVRDKEANMLASVTQCHLVEYSKSIFVSYPRILCSCACKDKDKSGAELERAILGHGLVNGVSVLLHPREILSLNYPMLIYHKINKID